MERRDQQECGSYNHRRAKPTDARRWFNNRHRRGEDYAQSSKGLRKILRTTSAESLVPSFSFPFVHLSIQTKNISFILRYPAKALVGTLTAAFLFHSHVQPSFRHIVLLIISLKDATLTCHSTKQSISSGRNIPVDISRPSKVPLSDKGTLQDDKRRHGIHKLLYYNCSMGKIYFRWRCERNSPLPPHVVMQPIRDANES